MKNASLWALTGAAGVVGIAYACAVPVAVEDCAPGNTSSNCVIITAASDFDAPDASFPAQGGNAGSGSTNPPSGGNSGSLSPPFGSAGSTSPPSGGSAGQGQAGSGSSAGTGGASGSAGSSAGTGGAAGSGAAGTGGTAGSGAAGMGGTTAQSNFDVAACDFADRTGCEAQACATACPTTDGGYCSNNCQTILTCVAAAPACITEADPMCGTAFQNPYRENTCTPQVNNSGSPTTANTPASVALALVRCLCSDPRP